MQCVIEAVHEGLELLDRAVRGADLADFSAHRDRDTVRLESTQVLRDVDALLEVAALLFGQRRLRQVDQRGRIHVDVVKPGVDRLARE